MADDSDSADPAPLPEYDRTWRHPAEHVDAQRKEHFSVAPPVGRRLLMLTAIVSVLASGSLLFVVVPKGISEYTSGNTDDQKVPVVTKGSASVAERPDLARATAGDVETTAICLGGRRFLVPLHLVDGTDPITVLHGATSSRASLVRRYESVELAVVRTAVSLPGVSPVGVRTLVDPRIAAESVGHVIVDAWRTIGFAPEKSIMTHDAEGDVAIGTTDPVHGLGIVIDAGGTVIGIVAHRTHSSWIVSRTLIARMMATGP